MNGERHKKEIRRLENKKWFWVSKDVIDKYGRILRSPGVAVYNVLASFANNRSQTCFPSQETIAEKLDLCRETVNRKIKLIQRIGLIRKRRLKGRCLYFLIQPNVIVNHIVCDPGVTRGVIVDHINYTKELNLINKTQSDDGFNNLKPIRLLLKRYDRRKE